MPCAADFQRFFDSVDHRLLEARLDAYLGDPGLVGLIMTWVRQAAEGPSGRGLPIGSPLSPLLSNLFLDSFDEEIACAGGRLVRYADDFLVLYRTRAEAEAAYGLATRQAEALLLELNRDKTAVVNLCEPFEFLGFRFEKHDSWRILATGVPARLEQLGWRESPRAAGFPAGSIRLPGEVGPEAAGSDATLLFGPMPGRLDVQDGQLTGCYENGSTTPPVPVERLGEVVLLGPISLSAAATRLLLEHRVPVLVADDHGQVLGTLAGANALVEGETLLAQVDRSRDPAFCLGFACAVVRAKLWNYATLALATRRGEDDHLPDRLFKRAAEAFRSQSLEELLGHEGAGAAAWYDEFGRRLPPGFSFPGRRAPDAEDPVNVLLNIAQTFLHRQCLLAVYVARLEPMLGFFHKHRPGHPALASDLQEPFRHLMDRAVLEAASTLSARHFTRADAGPFALRIDPWAYRQFMATLLRVMASSCAGLNQSESKSYGRQLLSMARGLKRQLLDPTLPWAPFRHADHDPEPPAVAAPPAAGSEQLAPGGSP